MLVSVQYAAFDRTMAVHIDGQPLSHVSRLTKYQSQPFSRWCAELCDAIAEEVNGSYRLSYTGRSCEARLLGQLARAHRACTEFASHAPQLADSALIRLKRLSSYVQSGLACKRLNRIVYVYTDGDAAAMQDTVSPMMPKLAFCRVRAQVQGLAALAAHPADEPAYVILFHSGAEKEALSAPLRAGRAAVLTADDAAAPLSVQGGVFSEHVSSQSWPTILEQYFELWTWTDLLCDALASCERGENAANPELAVLDRQEPMTVVTLPPSIEYGETAPVRVRVVPAGDVPADIVYRISDTSVIELTEQNALRAVGVGEAVVEAYRTGRSVKIAAQKITCYRRNRVRSIALRTDAADMLVGDRLALTWTFQPTDADDASRIRLVSSDGSVAAPDGQTAIVARRPGRCTVSAESERASAQCAIRVFPRLEAIDTDVTSIEAAVGSVTKLQIERRPAGATLQNLRYDVVPETLGRYDATLRGFYAQAPGSGELVIAAQDGSVSRRIPVEVAPEKHPVPVKRWLPFVLIGAAILLFILIGGDRLW